MSDDENITRTSRFLEALERLNQWLLKDFNVTTASKDERDVFIRYKNWEYGEKNGGDLQDYALWEQYRDDFAVFTVDHFKASNPTTVRKLRMCLRQHDCFVLRERMPEALFATIHKEEPVTWTREEIEQVVKQSGFYNSGVISYTIKTGGLAIRNGTGSLLDFASDNNNNHYHTPTTATYIADPANGNNNNHHHAPTTATYIADPANGNNNNHHHAPTTATYIADPANGNNNNHHHAPTTATYIADPAKDIINLDTPLHVDSLLHNRLILACQDQTAYSYTCFKPLATILGLVNDLQSSIDTYEKTYSTRPAPTHIAETDEPFTYYTGRKFHRNGRGGSRFPYHNQYTHSQQRPRFTAQRTQQCFVCKKKGIG
jgi:hypothetical protein